MKFLLQIGGYRASVENLLLQSNASQGTLTNAVSWVEMLLLGQLGSAIAIIAVALTGISMWSGHLSYRDGVRVLVGCFILFGAPTMAGGLTGLVARAPVAVTIDVSPTLQPNPSRVAPPAQTANPFDPYAGAQTTP